MRVLLTGFMPFSTHRVNPSQHIVEAVATRPQTGLEIIPEVLPVVYTDAGKRIDRLIHEHKPLAVILLGLAARRSEINLERVALNLNDAAIPDNAGDLATGRPIVEGGPAAYWSTLPLDTMHAALHRHGIPAVISNHAGAYVCNHAFFTARHTIEKHRYPTLCGFIHVPAQLPLNTMIEAVECCLQTLRENPDSGTLY